MKTKRSSAAWADPGAWFGRACEKMDQEAMLVASCVCKAWNKACLQSHSRLGPSWFPSNAKVLTLTKAALYLTKIELHSCAELSDEALAPVSALSCLDTLILTSAYQITHSTLMNLHGLTQLSYLNLSGALSLQTAPVGSLKSLSVLSFSGCSALHSISFGTGLPLLAQLSLAGCKMLTDSVIQTCLSLAPCLYSVDLGGCRVTDATLGTLQQHCMLKVLVLTCCADISNTGLALLSEIPSLQALDLTGCTSISDFGVAKLAELPELQKLYIQQCTKISRAGMVWMLQNSQSPKMRSAVSNTGAAQAVLGAEL